MLEKDWATATLKEAPYWREGMQPDEYNAERLYLYEHIEDYTRGTYLPLWKQNMETENKMSIDRIFCPLVDGEITKVDCMENRDIKDEFIPVEYKVKEDWKELCKNCQYYEY